MDHLSPMLSLQLESCTVVYDNSNKLEDINQDEESIPFVLLV
jgi:hypothetical protein